MEFEQRARVIVEPADQPRLDHVGDAGVVEEGAHLGEVLGVRRLEALEHDRSLGHDCAGSWIRRVERAQRVLVDPFLHLLRELGLVGAEVGTELLAVRGARLPRSEAPEPKLA